MTNERFTEIRSSAEVGKANGVTAERRYGGDAYADRVWLVNEVERLRAALTERREIVEDCERIKQRLQSEPGAFLPPGSVEASGLFRCGKCHTAMFLGPHAWECPKCSPSKSGPLPVDMRLVVNQTIWDLLKEKGMDMSNVVLQQNVPSKSEGS